MALHSTDQTRASANARRSFQRRLLSVDEWRGLLQRAPIGRAFARRSCVARDLRKRQRRHWRVGSRSQDVTQCCRSSTEPHSARRRRSAHSRSVITKLAHVGGDVRGILLLWRRNRESVAFRSRNHGERCPRVRRRTVAFSSSACAAPYARASRSGHGTRYQSLLDSLRDIQAVPSERVRVRGERDGSVVDDGGPTGSVFRSELVPRLRHNVRTIRGMRGCGASTEFPTREKAPCRLEMAFGAPAGVTVTVRVELGLTCAFVPRRESSSGI